MAQVSIFEVGLRDGLQNEPHPLDATVRARMAFRLIQAGVTRLEVGSVVPAKWVPAMAGSLEVYQQLQSMMTSAQPEIYLLVPNLVGLRQALNVGVKHVSFVHSVTESFAQKNLNRGLKELRQEIEQMCVQAQAAGVRIRCYLSVVWGCPYQGAVALDQVVQEVQFLSLLPIEEVVLSDTIGVGRLKDVFQVLDQVLPILGVHRVALHFHDTRGQGLVNVYGGYQRGIRVFDGSFGGLGGCPYAPQSSGNLASEEMVALFENLGVSTGICLKSFLESVQAFVNETGLKPRSRLALAGLWKHWS